jgi:hypothetical protein
VPPCVLKVNSVLYLGVEGVLFVWHASLPSFPQHPSNQLEPTAIAPLIVGAVLEHTDVSIVLNSWWVAECGYRRIFHLLPGEIARSTVGATMPGNRQHRVPVVGRARADILRSDIARRNPRRLTIVDAFPSAVPFEYMSRTATVTAGRSLDADEFSSELHRLLTSD